MIPAQIFQDLDEGRGMGSGGSSSQHSKSMINNDMCSFTKDTSSAPIEGIKSMQCTAIFIFSNNPR